MAPYSDLLDEVAGLRVQLVFSTTRASSEPSVLFRILDADVHVHIQTCQRRAVRGTDAMFDPV